MGDGIGKRPTTAIRVGGSSDIITVPQCHSGHCHCVTVSLLRLSWCPSLSVSYNIT